MYESQLAIRKVQSRIRRTASSMLSAASQLISAHIRRSVHAFMQTDLYEREEQKNHEFLIDIFNEIAKEREDAVLLLIGDGELKEQITAKVVPQSPPTYFHW